MILAGNRLLPAYRPLMVLDVNMSNFWKKYKEKYIIEPVKRRNGYYNLSDKLRLKLDWISSSVGEHKICEFLSWEEFCKVFVNTTFVHFFSCFGINRR